MKKPSDNNPDDSHAPRDDGAGDANESSQDSGILRPNLGHELGTEWLRGEGQDIDVVVSSRARLARNLAAHPFAAKATRAQRAQTLDSCRSWLLQAGLAERIMWVDLHEAPQLERMLLVERHLISKPHAKGKVHTLKPKPDAKSEGKSEGKSDAAESIEADAKAEAKREQRAADDPRGVAVSLPDERLSIMVNEEDHLRVQVIRSGRSLSDCWAAIDEVDDRIEAGLDYSFSSRFGYLTACPTNVGTGLRVSAMLHLPALRMTGDLDKVKRAASDMNIAVRGFYGEGSDSAGDFFQISNQTTLGKSERRIVDELDREIIPQIVEYERIARRTLMQKRRLVLEDQVFRSLGTLRTARLLPTEESMQLLSLVRLGVVLGLLKDIDLPAVNQLTLLVQPAHLQKFVGKELDQEQRRAARALLVRQKLSVRN